MQFFNKFMDITVLAQRQVFVAQQKQETTNVSQMVGVSVEQVVQISRLQIMQKTIEMP